MKEKREITERTPLSRTEAMWVSDWLRENGATVRGGWAGVYQMTPAEVAKKYRVSVAEVISAAKGEQR